MYVVNKRRYEERGYIFAERKKKLKVYEKRVFGKDFSCFDMSELPKDRMNESISKVSLYKIRI